MPRFNTFARRWRNAAFVTALAGVAAGGLAQAAPALASTPNSPDETLHVSSPNPQLGETYSVSAHCGAQLAPLCTAEEMTYQFYIQGSDGTKIPLCSATANLLSPNASCSFTVPNSLPGLQGQSAHTIYEDVSPFAIWPTWQSTSQVVFGTDLQHGTHVSPTGWHVNADGSASVRVPSFPGATGTLHYETPVFGYPGISLSPQGVLTLGKSHRLMPGWYNVPISETPASGQPRTVWVDAFVVTGTAAKFAGWSVRSPNGLPTGGVFYENSSTFPPGMTLSPTGLVSGSTHVGSWNAVANYTLHGTKTPFSILVMIYPSGS
jgi:hypothetical protein